MLVAHYIGNHSKDTLFVRAGWAVTRYTQGGVYGNVTHSEAIHAEHSDGSVTIASASLRDGGVRPKTVTLNAAHWLITDMHHWSVAQSIDLLHRTRGQGYDLRGALATRLPGVQDPNRWFCNEWVAHPYLQASATFGPHHLAALCMSIGRDVTAEFFGARA